MAICFWILMMVGFSDNWLWDTGQKTNFIPKYIIHAITAFSWFTLLLIQNLLIKKNNVKLHMTLGGTSMFFFFAMILSLAYLDLELFREFGRLDPMSLNTSLQAVIATIIVIIGYLNRTEKSSEHKFQMTFGSFCLIQPAMNRTAFYISDDLFFMPFISIYLILFAAFVWYKKKLTWYMIVWLLVWSFFFYYIFFK
jgi:hypothetical protein